jgi:hypothetical protein
MSWQRWAKLRKGPTVRPGWMDGMEGNWHLNLTNVGRCPECGELVQLPCLECRIRERIRNT